MYKKKIVWNNVLSINMYDVWTSNLLIIWIVYDMFTVHIFFLQTNQLKQLNILIKMEC